jgi:alkylated DNA repair dioxygenase AlkB
MTEHYPFMTSHDADVYLARLIEEVPWQKVQWAQGRYLPRLVYRDDYGDVAVLNELRQLVAEKITRRVDGIWCNMYEDGSHWTPWHQDNYDADVFTLSFGESRNFQMKEISTGQVETFLLEHGDAFYFDRHIDAKHKHCIPKTTKKIGIRISIVFFVR